MTMKKTIMIFAIALTMAACGTQSTKENAKEMNTLTFTTEQAAFMSAIACNEAKADYTALAEAINGLCLHGIPAFSECPWHFAEGDRTAQCRRQNH